MPDHRSILPPLISDPITAYLAMTGKDVTELSEECGIHRVHLHHMMSGKYRVTDQMAERLGKGTGKPPAFWRLQKVILRAYRH